MQRAVGIHLLQIANALELPNDDVLDALCELEKDGKLYFT